jgi:hypothetical protein
MSEQPFRDPAESPTVAALARLRSRRAHPVRLACAALVSYRKTASALTRESDVRTAERLDFQRLGNAVEGVFLPKYKKCIYVDRERTTQAQLSVRGYFFITYFESGKCIITWDHVPQTPSNDLLSSRATVGSFTDDYDAHCVEVRKLAATDAPIAVRDLDDAVTLGDFYYRGIVSIGLAIVTIFSALMPLVAVVAIGVWFLRRLLR